LNDFVEVKASKQSIANRKPVYGVGINDAPYMTGNVQCGICPFYQAWLSMLMRCYCEKYFERQPTYRHCSVTKEWLTFSAFREWMEKQDWQDKELDKDILNPGNKIYGPEHCVFAAQDVNNLLCDSGRSRGRWPQGVHFDKARGLFMAMLSTNGKRKYLGRFPTPEQAAYVYNRAKGKHIISVALAQHDRRVFVGLLKHAKLRLNAPITLEDSL